MKVSQLDKAIAQLESERAVLTLAIEKLRQQQQPKVPRVRKSKALHIERTAS